MTSSFSTPKTATGRAQASRPSHTAGLRHQVIAAHSSTELHRAIVCVRKVGGGRENPLSRSTRDVSACACSLPAPPVTDAVFRSTKEVAFTHGVFCLENEPDGMPGAKPRCRQDPAQIGSRCSVLKLRSCDRDANVQETFCCVIARPGTHRAHLPLSGAGLQAFHTQAFPGAYAAVRGLVQRRKVLSAS